MCGIAGFAGRNPPDAGLLRRMCDAIHHLYEDHGDRCVEHLRGMFAFALWDGRRRRLLLARDRVGKKPLFYRVTPDGIWFGSELKALLQDPSMPRAVDPAALHHYLTY